MNDDLQSMFDAEMGRAGGADPERRHVIVGTLAGEARRRRRVRAASWSASGAVAAVAIVAVAVASGPGWDGATRSVFEPGAASLTPDASGGSAGPTSAEPTASAATDPGDAITISIEPGSFVVSYLLDAATGEYAYYLLESDGTTMGLEAPQGVVPGRMVAWDGEHIVMMSPVPDGGDEGATRPAWAWGLTTGKWSGGSDAALSTPGGAGVRQMGVQSDGTIVTAVQVGDAAQWQQRDAVEFGAVVQGGSCAGPVSEAWLSPSGNSVLCLTYQAEGLVTPARYFLPGGYYESGPTELPGQVSDYRAAGWLDESTAIVEAHGELTAVDVRMDKTLQFEGLPADLDAGTARYVTATRTWWWQGDAEIVFDGPDMRTTVPCADPATASVVTSGARAVVECDSERGTRATWLVDLDTGTVILTSFGGLDVTVLGYPDTRG